MRVPAVWVVLASTLHALPASVSMSSESHDVSATAFEAAPEGRVVVSARINGAGPFRLLLDTGATHSSIAEPVADLVGAPPVARTVLGSALGGRERLVVRLDRLEVGPVQVTDLLPTTIPRDELEGIGRIDGVLGQDALAPLRYTLDFRARRVVWAGASPEAGASAASRALSLRLIPREGRFVVALPQGSSVLYLVPDSGADVVLLIDRGDRALPPMSVDSRPVELATLSARRLVRRAVVHELRVGPWPLRDLAAVVVPGAPAAHGATAGQSSDGLLPLHLFDRVTLDAEKGVLVVEGSPG